MSEVDADYFLIRLAGQGDVNAYGKLVFRYGNFCVRFAERMLGNRMDAEDVTQEVCLKIWKEAAKWQPQAKFSTWLYRVMFNACIDYKRKVVPFSMADDTEIEDASPNPEQSLDGKEDAKRVFTALQKLPERQRAAIVLSYYEGIKNQEAADTMSLDVGAFQQLLFRARQNLKDDLISFRVEEQNG